MRWNHTIVVIALTALVGGCAADRSTTQPTAKGEPAAAAVAAAAAPQVTVPNGSSPAKANAAHAPMSDSMRSGWNHGNGDLWVSLPKDGTLRLSDMYLDKDGTYRLKFGWWRGHAGEFSVTGRRLDAPAASLRYHAQPESYGAFGFLPSYLYFAGEGFWEVTGHLDDKTLTFVVQVVNR